MPISPNKVKKKVSMHAHARNGVQNVQYVEGSDIWGQMTGLVEMIDG